MAFERPAELSPQPADLLQFEERHPDLAKLLTPQARSAHKEHYTRQEEMTKIFDHQDNTALSLKEKKAIGVWLQSHSDRIHAPGHDLLTQADVLERYSKAQWTDHSKMLWSDMKMLKEVAAHFNEIALGGKSSKLIEKEDITDLTRGATVTRTPYDVTSTYPEGGLHRRNKDGVDFTLAKDGTMDFKTAKVDMHLGHDGDGYVTSKSKEPGEQFDIKLKRGTDDVWRGKTDNGDDFALAVDAHSVSLRAGEFDMLLTSKGGYIRDGDSPGSEVLIRPDASITMHSEDEGSVDIAKSDDGTMMGITDKGERQIMYPFGVSTDKTPDGKLFIDGGGPLKIPSVNVQADGQFEIPGENVVKSVKKDDGSYYAELPDGRTVTRNTDKSVVCTIPMSFTDIQISFQDDGRATMSADGEAVTFNPPVMHSSYLTQH